MLHDYTTVTAAGLESAVEDGIAAAERIVAKVVAPDTPSTYETVLAPLEDITDLVVRIDGETAFMGYVHPDADLRATGKQVEERLSKWGVELAFRDDLYAAVKRYSETDEAAHLEGDRARLLEFTMRDFRNAGHELDPVSRQKVKEMTTRLVELGIKFEQNIADDDSHLDLTREDLDGLPDSYIEALEPGEAPDTFRVTMAYPHVIPFFDNAKRRDLRQQIHALFNNRAVEENTALLEEAIGLRFEIARLFGKRSWMEHRLEDRMAKTPEAVEAFYDSLRDPLTKAANAEVAKMAELLASDTGDSTLRVFDWRYYDTQLRKTDYGVDPMEVADYFPLEQVVDGMFEITGDVFGLDYRKVDAPTWHADVTTYAIVDRPSGETICHFYMDLYPREGKFSHAAAFTLVPGRRLADGSYQKPVSAIVANFTKPTKTTPSLLQHTEVETLFHEFGHILHQTLTKADLARFSGTNTERDFVEAPSQIMQHWVWKPSVLARFAHHHESGEPIPTSLVERLTDAMRLNIALTKLRQMTYGILDVHLHGPESHKDMDRILRDATAVSILPFEEGTFFPASFGHMFGYDAGYYGYLWSEVYGDDMFSRFENEGYTSPAVGADYRRIILEQGGSVDAMDMLREFLGREPNNEAFLAKLGI